MALLEAHNDPRLNRHDAEPHKGNGVGVAFLTLLSIAVAGGGAYATNVGGIRERFETAPHSDGEVAGASTRSSAVTTETVQVARQTAPQRSRVRPGDPSDEAYYLPGPAHVLDMSKVADCAAARQRHDRHLFEQAECPGNL